MTSARGFSKPFVQASLLLACIALGTSAAAQSDGASEKQVSAEAALKLPELPVDYYDGLRAWDAGKPEVALTLWLRASELGDGKAMVRVGDGYSSGEYLPLQPLLAAYYYALASRHGVTLVRDPMADLSPGQREAVGAAVDEFRSVKLLPGGNKQVDLTPAGLRKAAQNGDLETLRRSAEIDPYNLGTSDENRWTLFHFAALGGQAEVTRYLLEVAQGDEWAITSNGAAGGYTAIQIAALSGSGEVVELLSRSKSFVIAETFQGMSSVDIARAAGHQELTVKLEAIAREETLRIQAGLNTLGYDVGIPDGVLSPATRAQLLKLFKERFNSSRLDNGLLGYIIERAAGRI